LFDVKQKSESDACILLSFTGLTAKPAPIDVGWWETNGAVHSVSER